jgi:hypothetical protein
MVIIASGVYVVSQYPESLTDICIKRVHRIPGILHEWVDLQPKLPLIHAVVSLMNV